MLRTRIIPVVLIDGFSVLKTIRFKERRNQGNPITVARIYNTRNVDELILLDIDASKENRSIDLLTIEEIASECFMPLTIGGGIKSIEDIRNVLDRGADKVVINTAAIENIEFIKNAVYQFGSQCIVASVDFKLENGKYKVFSRGKSMELDPFDWCEKLFKIGVGELFVASVELDGTMTSCDLKIIDGLANRVNIPIIYSGGVSSPDSYIEPLMHGVSAVAAASIFHFTRWTPDCVKKKLSESGFPVRLE